jgi:GAF domain-containing protein
MSSGRSDLFSNTEEFLHLFKRGAQFTKDLLGENERLRGRIACIEEEQAAASKTPEGWDKYRHEMVSRLQDLEQEYETVRVRLQQVEEENQQFASRYLEVEEENNNLANLYVASYQLHSTLDLDEVLKIVIEIAINLVGADTFAVYLLDGNSGELGVAGCEGAEPEEFPSCSEAGSVLKEVLESGKVYFSEPGEAPSFDRPILCIPLTVHDRPIGLIAVYALLQQKDGFTELDHELFSLLGGHASTALFAARLYSQSERKLNTIQGFIDLLTK